MRRPLKNRVVLVTGGGVRVGKALSLGLAAAGAKVAVHCHGSQEGAREVVRQVQEAGGQAQMYRADLSDASQIDPLVAQVEKDFGTVDALVNNAAIFLAHPFVETPLESLDRQWALNTRAPFLVAQACARRMLKQGHGDVVNIVDIGGLYVPWKNYSAYCMTKAALGALTSCLALELAPTIRVNAVAPGIVLGPVGWDPEKADRLARTVPAQRQGSPEDVLDSVLFLLEGPEYMTGQVLTVDGGSRLSASR
jgi:pteridine reductase